MVYSYVVGVLEKKGGVVGALEEKGAIGWKKDTRELPFNKKTHTHKKEKKKKKMKIE